MFTEPEEQRIVRAIANAERDNRGEVRVHVEERCPVAEPIDRARTLYRLLELDRTRDDTAVLLYIAEKSRVAAVSRRSCHLARIDAFELSADP